ncbi:hypothetical protein UZS20_25035, partial [Escherichia coli]|nr:hypothetical protein [Escherichia coli]
LLRCEKLNKSKRDMTNFYTINYGSELLDGGKLSESIGSKWPDDLTENTTEITTENKNTFRPEASQPDPQTT